MRFNLFESNWHEIEISTLIKEVNVKTSDFITYPLYSFTIEDGVTPKTDRYKRGFLVKKEGELFKIINNNNFIMNPMNLRFGAINFSRINKPVSVSGYYDIFTIDNCNYNHFWNAYFKNNKTLHRYNQIATGSLEEKKRVYFNQFIKMKFKVPNNDEKRKINELISLIEQRVLTQKKIIDKLKSLIISIKNTEFYYMKGFKEKLENILIELNEKTIINNQYDVLSSTVKGIFKQSDYFDRTVASENNIGYKIVKRGNIVISPQNLWMGNISYNDKFDMGIVSPSYKIFNISLNYNERYIFEMLTTKKSLYLFKTVSEQGASIVRRNLNYEAFMQLTFNVPSLNKQNNFIEQLSLLQSKLSLENKILSLLEQQKQYLLDKLFI